MSFARLWATARLDLLHNLRRPLFWIWLLILVLMAQGFSGGQMRIASGDSSVGGVKSYITSEFAMAMILGVLVLLLHTFFVAVAAGMPVQRDDELQVGAVIHATPLRPAEYVWGKFLAGWLSFVLMLVLHTLLHALFNHATTGAEEAEFIGPFVLGNYLRPALILGLPTVTFLAGTSFWIGLRFRRPILVFFTPVAVLLACVFLVWNWSPNWLPPAANRALMLLDPTGFRWLQETYLNVDRGAAYYNETPVAYSWDYLVSRASFFSLGFAAVVLAARRFAKTVRGGHLKVKGSGPWPDTSADAGPPARPKPLAALGMRAKRPGLLRGSWAVTQVEFRELLASPGLYLFLPLIVVETVANSAAFTGPFDTPPLLTSGVLAVRGVSFLAVMVCALLLFYTVESLRREEGSGLAPIHHATPVRTTSLLLGKAVANALVGVLAIGVTLLGDLGVLAYHGDAELDLLPFALVWCVILLPTFLVWTTFVSFLYSLVKNRYTTYALALGAIIWSANVDQQDGLSWAWNWPLWGALQWSDMGTFELIREELILNRALMLVSALFFTAMTVKLFPRQQRDTTSTVQRLRPKPLAIGALKLAPVWVPVLVLWTILDNRVDQGFQGEAADKVTKDYWRKNINTFKGAPTPDLVGVDVELELFPKTRGFEVRGTYQLRNELDEPLVTLLLTRGLWTRPTSLGEPGEGEPDGVLWTLNGEPFTPIDSAGLMLFQPTIPLAPGGEATIGFHHSGTVPNGATFKGGGADQFILPGGVVLHSFSPTFVPVLGFQEGIGVDEDNAADPKEWEQDHFLGETVSQFGTSGKPYPVRTKITGPAEFTLNGVGVKTSDEVNGDRRTVVWETDSPVRFFNVVAGRWTETRGEHGTAIYHHPDHTYNIPAMIEALDAARVHYSEWFYPYPWQELKISQFPGLAGYAQGFPTNITFSEAIGFLTRDEDDAADAPFLVTAHESAHQWWGNILTPGRGPGGNLLSEGTAHFSTLLLFEEVRGLEARIAFSERIEDQYGERRVADSERPMVRCDGNRPGDTTVTYDKAGWVFWMLLNHMGRERCLAGMRAFIGHYVEDPDHPVLQDFLEKMRPFAEDPGAFDAFTQQWFHEVVVPQYELEHVEHAGSEVTLTIRNVGTGTMPVEVCASSGERFEDDGDYQESRVTVTLGPGAEAQVTLPVDFEPERVVVDPDARVLQLRRSAARHEF